MPVYPFWVHMLKPQYGYEASGYQVYDLTNHKQF